MRSEAWRPAAAACNRSSREARDPALQALRPGCEELAVTAPAQMPVREARPRSPKSPRWSAERRASRVMGRKAPRQAPGVPRYVHAQRVPLHPNVSRRSAHPSFGVSEAKLQTPGAKNAPRERDGLFDIVRWELPKTVRRRAADSVRPEPPHPEERACASDA